MRMTCPSSRTIIRTQRSLLQGCPDFTKLSAIVKLLNLKGKYEASDKFFTELLGLIKKMLPAGNEMVEKTYQAKNVMKLMGSGYKKIHVCINNCLLYWKNDKDLTACRTCGYQGMEDSQAWRTIDEKFPEIAEDSRNLRLGISADGVDVNTGNRHHSVWTVLTVIYNLPPWYGRHNSVPHCIDFMHVEKNVAESLVRTLLHVSGKIKDGVNARFDMAELGVEPELFAMQEEDKTALPPAG
ncbi:putative reverse transcriptase domain-containing protein [Tanacetum coccineum]